MSPPSDHPDRPRNISQALMRQRARQLRQNATMPERALWNLLRDRRLSGFKFRRQHPIGPYVVDFYCPAQKLGLEIDGRSHDDRAAEDIRRQKALEAWGLRILRVSNDDVLDDPEAVLSAILRFVGSEPI